MKREPSSAGGVLGLAAAAMVVCCGITALASAGALAAVGAWLTNSVAVGALLAGAAVVGWIALRVRGRDGCAPLEREPSEPAAPDEASRAQ